MQKSIRTIQAEPTLPKRLRVAAYARVSCDKDTMLHSLAEQVSKYSRMIQSNTAWEYAGVYADEGITGTKEDRPEFQRLLADCRAGKIDMIITKSISRFARNTVTLLITVRELKLLGIDVFFEENKIHSLQAEGEVLLTILSSYAQAESFSASENTKWRIRKGFERGEVMNWRFMYGYNITKDSVEIDEAEAAVIREVFGRARDGESFRGICRDLNDRGIRGLLGGKWSTAYLYQVLSNEKYAGNALLQKTFVNNHIDKKVVRNNGELPRVFVEGSHPPIIDQATFDAVQVIIARNKAKRAGKKPPEQCEITGWNCSTYMAEGKAKCHGKKIPDTTLRSLITELLGMPEYDAGTFSELIDSIYSYEGNRLVFAFRDGTVREATWKDRSRAESWTPEMKAKAREDNKRRKTCGK